MATAWPVDLDSRKVVRFIDLFCGIGGFHVAVDQVGASHGLLAECVFASDIDEDCMKAYQANFGLLPAGDITKISEPDIPDHDILFAGFPCQAFSICGDRRGFEDSRGTLFFDVARILDEKRPAAFVLENVKQLATHDGGRTLSTIMRILGQLGYQAEWRILNALDYGVPQKRERTLIVGFREPAVFEWPAGGIPMRPLSEILEAEVPEFYWASSRIRSSRLASREGKAVFDEPTIWHENKSGNISAYPFSCAMRAGASYNYLLVNGERRLTEREMLRLQGFPEWFKIVCGYSATRRQAGNSVAVPCVAAVVDSVVSALRIAADRSKRSELAILQRRLIESGVEYRAS